jgi:hypothetical protein
MIRLAGGTMAVVVLEGRIGFNLPAFLLRRLYDIIRRRADIAFDADGVSDLQRRAPWRCRTRASVASGTVSQRAPEDTPLAKSIAMAIAPPAAIVPRRRPPPSRVRNDRHDGPLRRRQRPADSSVTSAALAVRLGTTP